VSPDIQELDNAGVAANWDITSDSLAAWLAGQVAANELLLVKCCQLDEDSSLHDLQQQNILDAGFLKITESACFKITLMNKDQFLSLA
jgi:5-(aminomethyl)-3-furanmethanol phosphate kinase